MRFGLAFILLIGLCSAQLPSKAFSNLDTLKVLAKLVATEQKGSIHIAKYHIIKVLDGIYESNILRVYHYQSILP